MREQRATFSLSIELLAAAIAGATAAFAQKLTFVARDIHKNCQSQHFSDSPNIRVSSRPFYRLLTVVHGERVPFQPIFRALSPFGHYLVHRRSKTSHHNDSSVTRSRTSSSIREKYPSHESPRFSCPYVRFSFLLSRNKCRLGRLATVAKEAGNFSRFLRQYSLLLSDLLFHLGQLTNFSGKWFLLQNFLTRASFSPFRSFILFTEFFSLLFLLLRPTPDCRPTPPPLPPAAAAPAAAASRQAIKRGRRAARRNRSFDAPLGQSSIPLFSPAARNRPARAVPSPKCNNLPCMFPCPNALPARPPARPP
jgi:hypothetical protein